MLQKPAPLRPGDVIGVISPGAAVDEAAVVAGVNVFERAGFRVRVGRHALARTGYLAGTDRDRAADIHAMFDDAEVRAIFATRGGYGTGRVLPLLDMSVIRAHPKIMVGHSDITFLLNDCLRRADLVTFHGPMVVNLGGNPSMALSLLAMLSGEHRGWQHSAPVIIRSGTAEGPLVGGCLSIVVAALGTPFAIQTDQRLLVLEDVNEKPFRIDRMLTQLRQAGAFDGVAGVIFGEMVGCTAGDGEQVTARHVIADAFANAPYPVVLGFSSGHGAHAFTVPIGIRARLAGERLTLLESPVQGAES